jgi:hypothetical protein
LLFGYVRNFEKCYFLGSYGGLRPLSELLFGYYLLSLSKVDWRALEGLACLGRPSSSGPPTLFPLSELLQASRNLKDELETVTFKGPAVHDLKTSISSKHHTIHAKLVAAKKDWNQKLSDIKAMKTPIHEGVPCETGAFFFED